MNLQDISLFDFHKSSDNSITPMLSNEDFLALLPYKVVIDISAITNQLSDQVERSMIIYDILTEDDVAMLGSRNNLRLRTIISMLLNNPMITEIPDKVGLDTSGPIAVLVLVMPKTTKLNLISNIGSPHNFDLPTLKQAFCTRASLKINAMIGYKKQKGKITFSVQGSMTAKRTTLLSTDYSDEVDEENLRNANIVLESYKPR